MPRIQEEAEKAGSLRSKAHLQMKEDIYESPVSMMRALQKIKTPSEIVFVVAF